MDIESIRAEAMKLSPEDRAELVLRIFKSIDALPEEESERVWHEELRRRDAEWAKKSDLARK